MSELLQDIGQRPWGLMQVSWMDGWSRQQEADDRAVAGAEGIGVRRGLLSTPSGGDMAGKGDR